MEFRVEASTVAWGRTALSAESVRAATRWLDGASLDELLGEVEFVEENRRRLEGLLQAALAEQPLLERAAQWKIDRIGCDLHDLTILVEDRMVEVKFYGKNDNPDAYFQWEGCTLAKWRVDPPLLGNLMVRWLVEREAPTDLNNQLNVDVYPVASFYEQGRGVEGEFLLSWDHLESFYRQSQFPQSAFAQRYIASLRQRGFDASLRAGQSLWRTIVSRSRRHGLRDDQAFVMLDFQADQVTVTGQIAGRDLQPLTCNKSEVSPEVLSLLRELAACSID